MLENICGEYHVLVVSGALEGETVTAEIQVINSVLPAVGGRFSITSYRNHFFKISAFLLLILP